MEKKVFRGRDSMKVLQWLSHYLPTLKPNSRYSVEVKAYRPKRSLDANAYFWTLADQLAERLGVTKTEVYLNAVREIGGVSETYCGKPEAINKLCQSWRAQGLGWLAETYPSKIEGCINAVLYYGSSSYDSKQMSSLIDSIIQDCHAQGIDTIPPDKKEKLVKEWGSEE